MRADGTLEEPDTLDDVHSIEHDNAPTEFTEHRDL